MERTYIAVADTAKLIRKALAEKFPGVKFTVRSKSYAGGASIRVGYVDFIPEKEVQKATARFEGAEFDGMQDLKTHVDEMSVSSDGSLRQVHYGADYVFVERQYGPLYCWLMDSQLDLRTTPPLRDRLMALWDHWRIAPDSNGRSSFGEHPDGSFTIEGMVYVDGYQWPEVVEVLKRSGVVATMSQEGQTYTLRFVPLPRN